jgi:GT2 family glycosyltransferase
MPDFALSITICSWNTIEDLRACLQSLREAKSEGDFEVVVVDNNSEDGSPDMVEQEFPEFRLLRQSKNLGFTGGHNLALAERRGFHAALLNSDTVVHPGAIAKLSHALTTQPSWGIIGPKLLNPDGSLQFSCRTFPNPFAAAFRNTFLGKLFPGNKLTRDYLMQDWDHAENREVDWVSGAALFIRGEVLEKVGGLDPSFFMYCEDVDLCKRTWVAGWKVMYLHDAVITHAIGRSSDKAPNRMIHRFHLSMFRYTQKHMISQQPLIVRPFTTVAAAAALALRAGIFIAKNQVDKVSRRMSK